MIRPINVGVIGTGWIGEIRARTCAAHPLVESLHLAEIDEARLARVAKDTRARSATTDYRELLQRKDIDDDSHRDIVLDTMRKGMVLPLSTMPGEQVATSTRAPWRPRPSTSSRRWPSTGRSS